jgi:HEAT repeat protein
MKALLGLVGIVLCATVATATDADEWIKQLKDKDPEVRRGAAKSLGEAPGPDPKPAVEALTLALKDRDLFVRRFAAQSLGEIGPNAKAAAPALVATLDDPKREVAEAAAAALGRLGSAAVEPLIKVVKEGNQDIAVRRKAVEALGNIGPDAKAALPVLTEALQLTPKKKGKDKPPDLRTEAATALGAIANADDQAVLDALTNLVNDKKLGDRNLKKAAAEAIKSIQGRKVS